MQNNQQPLKYPAVENAEDLEILFEENGNLLKYMQLKPEKRKHYEQLKDQKPNSSQKSDDLLKTAFLALFSPVNPKNTTNCCYAYLQKEALDLHMAQEALQEIEMQLKMVLEATKTNIWIWNIQTDEIASLDRNAQLFGLKISSFEGKFEIFLDCIYPGDRDRFLQSIERSIQSGEEFDIEFRTVGSDCKIRWTHTKGKAFYDESGKAVRLVGIELDISEKKLLQEQFFRAQRLESIGTLASGISHDLNNILTAILAADQLLLKVNLPEEKQRWLMTVIERNAKRGASLVKQVLSFARGIEAGCNIVQVKEIILEIEEIIKETFPKSIEVYTHTEPELWAVSVNATQLHQVLMNLCVNARDAMPNGGSLSISAKNISIDENYTRMTVDAQVGSYIVISVTDTGTGIPPEILDRIFEPFFTTKEKDKGTGLGLSTVMGIVKNHGGFVKVSSKIDQGTKFKIFLPAVEQNETLRSNKMNLPVGNGELILVVDDEASILEITQASLESYNYRAIAASDGIEAIALYAQHKSEISLVLLDMMMPLLDGTTTIRTLRKIDPSVKIIAVSGFSGSDRQASAAGVEVFLSKPYTTEELLQTINLVLNSGTQYKCEILPMY